MDKYIPVVRNGGYYVYGWNDYCEAYLQIADFGNNAGKMREYLRLLRADSND